MLSVVVLSAIKLSVNMLIVVMQSVFKLSVMLIVVMLSVVVFALSLKADRQSM